MEAMDFMDPLRRRRHDAMLFIGYGLIAIAILLLTIILLFVAYGFGLKNGQVILNGLLFVSSTPSSAEVYIDGARYHNNTNTQIVLPAGTYNFALKRSGYRDWQRTITVDGGDVQSYGYPFLFPSSLTATSKHEYAAAPALMTESPNRRWLLVAQPGQLTSFDEYDLNNPKQEPAPVDLPAALVTAGKTQSIAQVEWSDDNNYLLLKHGYDGKTEYLLLNRSQPAQSVNLTQTYALVSPGLQLQLSNKKSDQYIIYDPVQHTLARATLGTPTVQPYLSGVLAYSTYGDNTVLYVTPDPADPAKVAIDLYNGRQTYVIRHDTPSATYLLNLTTYSGDLYVATSSPSENVAYIYKNPIDQIANAHLGAAIPVRLLSIKAPNYLAFSASAQYVLFENGPHLAVYDAENDQGYSYTITDTLDAPQSHVAWMNAAQLVYVSGGQVVASDYDGQNRQALVSADARYPQSFDQSYKFLYALVPGASDKSHEVLTATSLRAPQDQ